MARKAVVVCWLPRERAKLIWRAPAAAWRRLVGADLRRKYSSCGGAVQSVVLEACLALGSHVELRPTLAVKAGVCYEIRCLCRPLCGHREVHVWLRLQVVWYLRGGLRGGLLVSRVGGRRSGSGGRRGVPLFKNLWIHDKRSKTGTRDARRGEGGRGFKKEADRCSRGAAPVARHCGAGRMEP